MTEVLATQHGGWRRLRVAAVGLLWLLAATGKAEIIDRVVAVVGNQAITASEVDRQVRLEAMLNSEPLHIDAQHRHDALQRLIAVKLIQAEVIMAGFLRVSEEEVQRRLEESKQETYLDGATFDQALNTYELHEEDVADFWRQVISYQRFKDFRFKTGLELSREEVTAYYESHVVPDFKTAGGREPPPLDEIYDKVEQAALEDRANTLLEQWLKETRPQTRIVILEEHNPQSPKEGDSPPTTSTAQPRRGPQ